MDWHSPADRIGNNHQALWKSLIITTLTLTRLGLFYERRVEKLLTDLAKLRIMEKTGERPKRPARDIVWRPGCRRERDGVRVVITP
jgi:hypothetical protein